MECDVVCGAQKGRRGGEEGSHAILSVGVHWRSLWNIRWQPVLFNICVRTNIDNQLQIACFPLC